MSRWRPKGAMFRCRRGNAQREAKRPPPARATQRETQIPLKGAGMRLSRGPGTGQSKGKEFSPLGKTPAWAAREAMKEGKQQSNESN
jgi:hypothetical protein